MMNLKDRIEKELRVSMSEADANKLIGYMNCRGFYTAHCGSHDHWSGGLAEHSWRTCVSGLKEWKRAINEDAIVAQLVKREDVVIASLLHDLCDTTRYLDPQDQDIVRKSGRHGRRSGTIISTLLGIHLRNCQYYAIVDHQHGLSSHEGLSDEDRPQYKALLDILQKADHGAAGIAWNARKFLADLKGKAPSDIDELRMVAMDRTKQMVDNKIYVDSAYESHPVKGFNRNNIKWNMRTAVVDDVNGFAQKYSLMIDYTDFITNAHTLWCKTRERMCLVIGGDNSCVTSSRPLRNSNRPEQELLICSNLLNSLYSSEKINDVARYKFTTQKDIAEHLPNASSMYLPSVMIIRNGASDGFRQVEPWEINVLVVMNQQFKQFFVRSEPLHLLG